MDSLKDSLNALADMFQQKMSEFQQGLDNSPIENVSLAAEFQSFRSFVLSAMNTLQRQVEFLGTEVDRLETHRRRKMLLFHGVNEVKSEDVTERVSSLIREHLGVAGFSEACIKASHRMGRPTENKPRPIIVKFADVIVRDKVWFSKTGFKGSGITESEFLTKSRHSIFIDARKKYGINKTWTRDGTIHVIAPDGSRHRVECRADLDSISSTPSISKAQAPGTSSSRPKRAVRKYYKYVEDVLVSVHRTEESLRRLKQIRDMGTQQTSDSPGVTDGDKIRLQLNVDVTSYAGLAKSLHVNVNSVHKLTELSSMVTDAVKNIDIK